MGKWALGLVGSIITGVVLWLLTTVFFPRLFSDIMPAAPVPPPPTKVVRVECTANPPTVAPGSTTEISVKVTRGGEPVEGAAVTMTVPNTGSEASGTTYSGGVFRLPWTAPRNSASAYVFPASVKLDGVRTPEEELFGSFGTTCEIFVRR
jgi:hypothetical protein